MTFFHRKFNLTLALFVSAAIGLGAPRAMAAENANGIAVIIGNKSYADKDIPKVSFADRDAQAMRRYVIDVLGFRNENIIMLSDASQAQMQSTFGRKGNHRGRAFQYVRPGKSDLFVFYSGHGIPGLKDRRSYLLPTDAAIATAEINGYPLDVLYENLDKLNARSVTVFIDACFTGSSHGGPLIKAASGLQVLPKPVKAATPMTVITASSRDQLASWDQDARHGLFTEYLLRALYGAADRRPWGNGDGKVTVGEIRTYLNDEMRFRARRAFNREQTPTVIGDERRVMVASLDSIPRRPNLDDRPRQSSPPFDERREVLIERRERDMIALEPAVVRASPSVNSPRVSQLFKGTVIHILGKVKDEPWLAVERKGIHIGYVFQPLLRDKNIVPVSQSAPQPTYKPIYQPTPRPTYEPTYRPPPQLPPPTATRSWPPPQSMPWPPRAYPQAQPPAWPKPDIVLYNLGITIKQWLARSNRKLKARQPYVVIREGRAIQNRFGKDKRIQKVLKRAYRMAKKMKISPDRKVYSSNRKRRVTTFRWTDGRGW